MRLVEYRRQGQNMFYFPKDNYILNLYCEIAKPLDEPEDS